MKSIRWKPYKIETKFGSVEMTGEDLDRHPRIIDQIASYHGKGTPISFEEARSLYFEERSKVAKDQDQRNWLWANWVSWLQEVKGHYIELRGDEFEESVGHIISSSDLEEGKINYDFTL